MACLIWGSKGILSRGIINGQVVQNTRERLDRAVANMEWRVKFPASTITHLFSHASDH